MSARQRLQAEIQQAIQAQLWDMLCDPGPWLTQGQQDAAEDLADTIMGRLCADLTPGDIHGWMIQKYGDRRVYRVTEFDIEDSSPDGWSWAVYTEREDEDDG